MENKSYEMQVGMNVTWFQQQLKSGDFWKGCSYPQHLENVNNNMESWGAARNSGGEIHFLGIFCFWNRDQIWDSLGTSLTENHVIHYIPRMKTLDVLCPGQVLLSQEGDQIWGSLGTLFEILVPFSHIATCKCCIALSPE